MKDSTYMMDLYEGFIKKDSEYEGVFEKDSIEKDSLK